MITIRSEHARDIKAREALLDDVFGIERHAKTCERLREGRLPVRGLSFISEDDGCLIGTVRLWHVEAGTAGASLILGPLAVAKAKRSSGVGARLMRTALRRAAMLGHRSILLVGDVSYYERFGFSANLTQRLCLPGPVDPKRFLGLELETGALFDAIGQVFATGVLNSNHSDVVLHQSASHRSRLMNLAA